MSVIIDLILKWSEEDNDMHLAFDNNLDCSDFDFFLFEDGLQFARTVLQLVNLLAI